MRDISNLETRLSKVTHEAVSFERNTEMFGVIIKEDRCVIVNEIAAKLTIRDSTVQGVI